MAEKSGKEKFTPISDPKFRLEMIIGRTGHVREKYGGYEIAVTEPDSFPWYEVFNLLLSISSDVWVVKQGSEILIQSK